MSGHRPFSDLTECLPTARKARIDEKAAALNAALTLQERLKAQPGSQEEPGRSARPIKDKSP